MTNDPTFPPSSPRDQVTDPQKEARGVRYVACDPATGANFSATIAYSVEILDDGTYRHVLSPLPLYPREV